MLNNPLSQIKPLVINLFYRKGVPGVGSYNPKTDGDISLRTKDQRKDNYKCVFDSKVPREADFLLDGDKSLLKDGQV